MTPDVLDRYASDRLRAEVRWATWELTVFEVSVPEREPVFVAVRRSHLDGFLRDLWSGALDAELTAQAASPAIHRRKLSDGDAVVGVAVVGVVVDPTSLPPAERDRHTGRIGGNPPRGRRRKREDQHEDPSRHVPKPKRALLVGAAVAAVVVVAAVAAAAGGGDDNLTVSGPTGPTLPPLVTSPTTPTTAFVESFSGMYRVTGTITDYEVTPDAAGTTAFEVGQTLTFEMHCGSILVETGERECSPSPVPGSFLIDGAPPNYEYEGVPIKWFSVEDLIAGSGRTIVEGTPCTGADEDNPEPIIEVDMDGYGEETISGTYRHTYDTLDCTLASGGYHILENITLEFTGELLEDGGTVYDPATSTTTVPPSDDGMDVPPPVVGTA